MAYSPPTTAWAASAPPTMRNLTWRDVMSSGLAAALMRNNRPANSLSEALGNIGNAFMAAPGFAQARRESEYYEEMDRRERERKEREQKERQARQDAMAEERLSMAKATMAANRAKDQISAAQEEELRGARLSAVDVATRDPAAALRFLGAPEAEGRPAVQGQKDAIMGSAETGIGFESQMDYLAGPPTASPVYYEGTEIPVPGKVNIKGGIHTLPASGRGGGSAAPGGADPGRAQQVEDLLRGTAPGTAERIQTLADDYIRGGKTTLNKLHNERESLEKADRNELRWWAERHAVAQLAREHAEAGSLGPYDPNVDAKLLPLIEQNMQLAKQPGARQYVDQGRSPKDIVQFLSQRKARDEITQQRVEEARQEEERVRQAEQVAQQVGQQADIETSMPSHNITPSTPYAPPGNGSPNAGDGEPASKGQVAAEGQMTAEQKEEFAKIFTVAKTRAMSRAQRGLTAEEIKGIEARYEQLLRENNGRHADALVFLRRELQL